MKLAAIDIGSNAIRLQVIRVIQDDQGNISFKKLEFIRFPLRLGKDVFANGYISPESEEKFDKLMRTFCLLIELYEVDGYIARATSAMREAKNGKAIAERMAEHYKLEIKIISGKEEAAFLNKAILPYLGDGAYLHIDVGGGSTELNLYFNKTVIGNQSFKIGSVRELTERRRRNVFKKIQEWKAAVGVDIRGAVTAVGTGGNINKLYKLSNQKQKGRSGISLAELQALRAYVAEFSYEQRMSILKMNPDRADVVVPASEIYVEVMRAFGADHILVPGVGLKDGLLYSLYADLIGGEVGDIQFLDQF